MKNEEKKKFKICGEGFVEALHYREESFLHRMGRICWEGELCILAEESLTLPHVGKNLRRRIALHCKGKKA